MPEPVPDDAHFTAEIDRLKAQFPKTRDLYREVCALLFFRFGITPTANRLYQIVHRGSMSTPTAVLSEFWADLREKSRVRIEHPDLPDDVRDAAGVLVAKLWTHARAAADTSLAALRADVDAQLHDAQQSTAALQADLTRTETALEQRTSALLAAQVRIHELEQSLAQAQAARAALDAEFAQLQQHAHAQQAALTAVAAERDRLRADADLADQRAAAAHARLQRDADAARAERDALQQQLGDLRHRNGTLEGQLDALRELNAWQRAKQPARKAASEKTEKTEKSATKKPARPAAKKPAAAASRPSRKVKRGPSGPRSES